jgi:hypothetical protein
MEAARSPELERLDVFVGEWKMESPFSAGVFEWLPGERFLIQRWAVEHPDAPDGIAIIGFDGKTRAYAQHYFDSRGVARVYEMSLDDGVWKLWREASAPDFSQRFAGTFSEDGNTIEGRWDICTDGSTWEPDFELNYLRV